MNDETRQQLKHKNLRVLWFTWFLLIYWVKWLKMSKTIINIWLKYEINGVISSLFLNI